MALKSVHVAFDGDLAKYLANKFQSDFHIVKLKSNIYEVILPIEQAQELESIEIGTNTRIPIDQVQDAYYTFLSTCKAKFVAKSVLAQLRSLQLQGEDAASPIWADKYEGWDPEYALYYETSKQWEKENDKIDIPKMRQLPSRHAATSVSVDTEVKTYVIDITGIQLMVYEPRRQQVQLPAILYAHAGGFVLGGHESEKAEITRLAARTGCPVFVPAYSLAPEHPFPSGVEDLHRASQYLRTGQGATRFNIDPYNVFVVGLSSGASYVLLLMLRDARLKPEIQLRGGCAVAPIINHRAKDDDALRRQQKGPGLPSSRLLDYQDYYLPSSQPCDPNEANLNSLTLIELQQLRLPRLYIAIMELDILAAETIQFCDLLRRSQKDVQGVVWWGMPHAAFVHGRIMQQSRNLQDSVVAFIRGEYVSSW